MLSAAYKKLGFTVVELIVVIVVIGILATIGVVAWRGIQERAYDTERLNELKNIESIYLLYASQEHKYPAAPSYGSFCIGTGFATKAEIDQSFDYMGVAAGDRWSPAELASPAPGYCRNSRSYGSGNWYARSAVNTGLNDRLATIGKLPTNNQERQRGAWLTGPYATYWRDGSGTQFITITQAFRGSCPGSTTFSYSDGTITLCSIVLPQKPYDVLG